MRAPASGHPFGDDLPDAVRRQLGPMVVPEWIGLAGGTVARGPVDRSRGAVEEGAGAPAPVHQQAESLGSRHHLLLEIVVGRPSHGEIQDEVVVIVELVEGPRRQVEGHQRGADVAELLRICRCAQPRQGIHLVVDRERPHNRRRHCPRGSGHQDLESLELLLIRDRGGHHGVRSGTLTRPRVRRRPRARPRPRRSAAWPRSSARDPTNPGLRRRCGRRDDRPHTRAGT